MTPASAEPVLDEFASGGRVSTANGCALITIQFHYRIRYIGHAPRDQGEELRITFRPIDKFLTDDTSIIRREAVPVERASLAGVSAVTIDVDRAMGPALRIEFNQPVPWDVLQFGSFDNVLIAVPKPGSSAACKVKDMLAQPLSGEDSTVPVRGASSYPQRRGKITASDIKVVEASMDEARFAIRTKRYIEAIALLKKVLAYPENKYTADALETLAEARQKAGQAEQARADLEEYLRRYPNSDAVARIKQRLGTGPEGSPLRPSLTSEGKRTEEEGKRNWTMSGSVSSFYVSNDSTTTLKDITIAPNPNADPDAHRVHQGSMLTNFDLYGSINDEEMRTKFKLAGSFEKAMRVDNYDLDRYGLSTAYVETNLKSVDVTARVGRQTRDAAGVIGRFDGAVLSWQINDRYRLNGVTGASNWSRFDAPFKDQRYFAGTSLDIAKVLPGLDMSLFIIQQNDRWLLDRRAIGTELRYFQDNKSALGLIDYDIHFQRFNAGVFSGSYTFEDKSILSGSYDYRRVPYLSSWSALQGQPFLTLFDMLKSYTQEEVRQFAIDRTPVFQAAMMSYSRPLSENLQFSMDGTVTNMAGTPPSGGVDGTMPSGTEYYLSGQIVDSNLFREGDMYVGALRYAHLADSSAYFMDLNMRYPWSETLRINPRFRAGYRYGRGIPLKEITVLPSFLFDYKLAKNLTLESEIGVQWVRSDVAGIQSSTKNLYFTLGLRSDFATEGSYRCTVRIAPCLGLWMGGGLTPAQATADSHHYRDTLERKETPQEEGAVALQSGARYWVSRGSNSYDYFGDLTPTTRVSRLAYLSGPSHAGELFFRADARQGMLRDFFLRGTIGGGVGNGKLYDEDFEPITSPYSKTVSNSSAKLAYGSLDFGYNLFTNDWLRIGAFAGFHFSFDRTHASGCVQLATNAICSTPVPTSVRLITERDRWSSLRAGTIFDVNVTDRLRWSTEIAITASRQNALDTHYATFGLDPANGLGGGLQFETSLNYQFSDRVSFGVGARWWRSRTDAFDMFGQLLRYQTDRYGVFAQTSYRTSWGDFKPALPDSGRAR